MANDLTIPGTHDTAAWVDAIKLIDTDEPVIGGLDGVDNAQAIQLAKRTTWLRAVIARVVDAAEVDPDSANLDQLLEAIAAMILAGSQPNTMPVIQKAAAYIAVVGDRTKTIEATAGTWSLGFDLAATLANGWWCAVRNSGAGEITLDPNGAELIDGVATVTLSPGASCLVVCDGAGLRTIGKSVGAAGAVAGTSRGLVITATGTSAPVSIAVDEIVLSSAVGSYKTFAGVAVAASLAVAGAGGLDTGAAAISTWYAVWLIGKDDGTVAGLLSLSATAPTMPAGYTFKAFVGWVRSDSSANKYPLSTWQYGRTGGYKVKAGTNVTAFSAVASGAQGSATAPTWVSVSLAAFVPPNARFASFVSVDNSAGETILSPSGAHGGLSSLSNPPPFCQDSSGTAYEGVPCTLALETLAIYRAASGGATFITGWEF